MVPASTFRLVAKAIPAAHSDQAHLPEPPARAAPFHRSSPRRPVTTRSAAEPELPPVRPGPYWGGIDVGLLQDPSRRAGSEPVAEPGQFTVHSAVAPGRILAGQAQQQ